MSEIEIEFKAIEKEIEVLTPRKIRENIHSKIFSLAHIFYDIAKR